MKAQDLFLWFPVIEIRVDIPSSGLIYFDVGVVSKKFSLSLFETPWDCLAVPSSDLQNERNTSQTVYKVLNFMWLKFLLIWRYFRFWSLINGIVVPENMPRCINNCHNLESFWKNWHASFNKWLVRYVYIPLGGAQKKMLNVWAILTFVAIWHDLEWKLISWAWLTCIFLISEMLVKSVAKGFQVEGALSRFIFRELSAVAGG